ncbi:hypothetical protein BUALT_Bualt13G0038500 [Buddleja alternifolia]|uniref:NAC domain-containing protein n=1 Tax=Buddleja alternifolia TaxID=168488 RepID=A0AAV6WT20_9LAMI|nr:hypothetical protein BUALT_Bualt13G0038500 [Buddleja alternifolia]
MESDQQNPNFMTPGNNNYTEDKKPVNNNGQNPVYIQQQQTPVYNFPIGYRFVPEDDELITHYLKLRIANEPIPVGFIYDANIYQYNPQALTARYSSFKKDEWLFFSPRDRKYPNGTRPNRAAGNGYWKATGADKHIRDDTNKLIGFRKALVFYEGKPPRGTKSNWIMHEFRVSDPTRNKRNASDMRLDDWVLCRIYLKPPKPDKKSSEKSEVVPVDNQFSPQVISEDNTTPENSNDNIPEGQIQENVGVVKRYDIGLLSNAYRSNGYRVLPVYHNIDQAPPLMDNFCHASYINPQSNMEFQAMVDHNGGTISLDDQDLFSMQDLYCGQEGEFWGNENSLGFSNLGAQHFSSSNGDVPTLDEFLDNVPPNIPNNDQFQPKKENNMSDEDID